MKIVLIVIGVLVLLAVLFVVWRIWATIRGGRRADLGLLARVEPVIVALRENRTPSSADLERFASDRVTRRVLYDTLDTADRSELFPAQWRTWPAMAEADLVLWLNHPNELGAPPDEIEVMATVAAPGDDQPRRHYFVFRFRSHPPHWAASSGWTAGVAGPYDLDATPAPGGHGTFSRFEPWDSRTPEDHVGVVHRQVALPTPLPSAGEGRR